MHPRSHLTALWCAVLALPSLASATVISGLETYAKDPAKGILDDAGKKADQTLSRGQEVGNGMITHLGMELDTATRSALLGLAANVNKTVADLSVGEQQALLTVLQLESKVDQVKDVAYNLRDTTAVDLTDWQSHWIFASTPDFMVQSIRGTALLPQAGDYSLVITAVGLGINADSKADITASLNGKPITLTQVDQSHDSGQATLGIPNTAIASLFSADRLQVTTLDLGIDVSRKHWWWWRKHHYEFPVHVLLYPAKQATVTVHVTNPTFDWTPAGEVLGAPVSTGDANGCKYCSSSCTTKNNTEVTVPGGHSPTAVGDERLVAGNVNDLQCLSGDLCTFSTKKSVDGPSNGGTRVHAYFETCSRPMSWQLHGHVQKWQQTGTKTTDTRLDLVLDQPQTLQLPDGVDLIKIDVVAFTKQTYSFVQGVEDDPHHIVSASRAMGSPYLVVSASGAIAN